jgi:hypothetical protein
MSSLADKQEELLRQRQAVLATLGLDKLAADFKEVSSAAKAMSAATKRGLKRKIEDVSAPTRSSSR